MHQKTANTEGTSRGRRMQRGWGYRVPSFPSLRNDAKQSRSERGRIMDLWCHHLLGKGPLAVDPCRKGLAHLGSEATRGFTLVESLLLQDHLDCDAHL